MKAVRKKIEERTLSAPGSGQDQHFPELVAKPLATLTELMSWSPQTANLFARAAVKLPKCSSSGLQPRTGKLRTLVCHDMAGGYLDDKYVQGNGRHDAYRFFNWLSIDVYVYFSHHFITIPPPCWIDAAHRHGVPVLGTFITEWDAGKELCKTLFSSLGNASAAAKKMVEIAKYYGFDGWLINIENEVKSSHVASVLHFLAELQTLMHREISGSLVLWYDSITLSGKLLWQNELNKNNSAYFDKCDGIFLNYTWSEAQLRDTAEFARRTDRQGDVFVGIDVFGRGMIGGGGFNVHQAVALGRKHHLAIALFAPGWVYENLGSENFATNECRFWNLLRPYLMPNAVTQLPFYTSFCQGFGHKFFIEGEVALEKPWSNMSLQHVQPFYRAVASGCNDEGSSQADLQHTIEHYVETAYYGGGCLRLHRPAGERLNQRDVDIYQWRMVDFSVTTSQDLFVTIRYHSKCSGEVETCLCLELGDTNQKKSQAIVCPIECNDQSAAWCSGHFVDVGVVATIHSVSDCDVPVNLRSAAVSGSTDHFWQQRVYRIDGKLLATCLVEGLVFTAKAPAGHEVDFLIGEVQILTADELDAAKQKKCVTNLSAHVSKHPNASSDIARIELSWDGGTDDVFCYHVWHVVTDDDRHPSAAVGKNGDGTIWTLLGSTPAQRYILQLSKPVADSVEIAVQAMYKSGVKEQRAVTARILTKV